MRPTLELPPPGPPPPTKAVTERIAGSSSTICAKSLLLDPHGVKADVLRGAGRAAHAPGVLLREEALGHDHEEIDVEGDGAKQDAEHQPLVAQNPAQAACVFVVHPLEGALTGAVNGAVADLVARFEKLRAEHGRGCERDQQRDGNGYGECNGKLAEELADNAAHEQNRNEDGNQRQAHRETVKPISREPFIAAS